MNLPDHTLIKFAARYKIFPFPVFILFTLIFIYSIGFSQENKSKRVLNHKVFVRAGSIVILPDSAIVIPRDTLLLIPYNKKYQVKELNRQERALFDSLGIKAGKNIVTRTLFEALVVATEVPLQDGPDFSDPEFTYLPYQGKIIRRIRLKKVDVLAGSIFDTTQVARDSFSKTLNHLHIDSRDYVIQRNLLFREGDSLKSQVFADNERILRSLPYIEDARFAVIPTDNEQEVEVVVITKDVFSIGISPSITSLSKSRLEIYDRNLLGWGTELKYTLHYDADQNPRTGYDVNYVMNNIRGSFVTGKIIFGQTFENKQYLLSLDRQFLTPQTRYAGALEAGQLSQIQQMTIPDSLLRFHYTFKFLDFWMGRSIQVGGKESRENWIFSGRYRRDDVSERPYVSADSNFTYHSADMILGSILFQELRYLRSNMILSFGVTEDVPVGYLHRLIAGFEWEEFMNKPYLGFESIYSQISDRWGFWAIQGRIGGYYYQDKVREAMMQIRGTYFTHLSRGKRFKFRHLANLNYVMGFNRLPGETITLRDEEIRGVVADQPVASDKFVLSLESIAFSPWNLIGFRFAFFTFIDLGFLSADHQIFRSDTFYGNFGMGCRIRNESLVFKTLIIRIGYFPHLPNDSSKWDFAVVSRDPAYFASPPPGKPSIFSFQ